MRPPGGALLSATAHPSKTRRSARSESEKTCPHRLSGRGATAAARQCAPDLDRARALPAPIPGRAVAPSPTTTIRSVSSRMASGRSERAGRKNGVGGHRATAHLPCFVGAPPPPPPPHLRPLAPGAARTCAGLIRTFLTRWPRTAPWLGFVPAARRAPPPRPAYSAPVRRSASPLRLFSFFAHVFLDFYDGVPSAGAIWVAGGPVLACRL